MIKFGELTFGEVTFGEMTTVGKMIFGELTFGEVLGNRCWSCQFQIKAALVNH